MSPLPGDAQIGRVDMGVDVDLKPGQAIVAPGNSRVLGIMPGWYSGQPYLALQLLDGPMKGRNYYVAEQIDIAVAVGQVVQQGQPIAHYAASGTGIEIGWAGSDWQQTLAQAQGNTGDSSHGNAPAGVSFKSFLDSLGEHAAPNVPVGAGPGQVGVSSPQGSANADLVTSQAAAGPQVPPAPGTAAFRAVGRHSGPSPRHTAQFLAAVQPAAGAPPAAEPAGGTPQVGPAAGSQPSVQQISGQPAVAQVPGQAQAGQSGVAQVPDHAQAGQAGPGAGQVADLATGPGAYPGDNAPKPEIARWMAAEAQRYGLPRELPAMAALVESGLHNDPSGDRDSVGYFQMRTGIWDTGSYAGFTHNPSLQLKWFIDQAVALKNERLKSDPGFGMDPSQYGNWIADIERPAAEYRGRYQLRLGEARQLLGG